ncbi:MAG: hypothetical protein LUF91_02480, partial [Oscillospiraceae bacterium]|nr:hypothetical protein [Oscillospiraceae bacterium]
LWRNRVALNGAACEAVSQYVRRQMRKQQRQPVFLIGGFRFRFLRTKKNFDGGAENCDDEGGEQHADTLRAKNQNAACKKQRRRIVRRLCLVSVCLFCRLAQRADDFSDVLCKLLYNFIR